MREKPELCPKSELFGEAYPSQTNSKFEQLFYFYFRLDKLT